MCEWCRGGVLPFSPIRRPRLRRGQRRCWANSWSRRARSTRPSSPRPGCSRASRTRSSGEFCSPTGSFLATISAGAGAAVGDRPDRPRRQPCRPELVRGIDPYRCLDLEAVPWRQVGGTPGGGGRQPRQRGGGDGGLRRRGGARGAGAGGAEDIRRAITDAFAGRLRDDARHAVRRRSAAAHGRWAEPAAGGRDRRGGAGGRACGAAAGAADPSWDGSCWRTP